MIGISTTNPISDIQRIYREAYLNTSDFLPSPKFSQLIHGASYVSSHCISPNHINSNRDFIVIELRKYGLRIDGLSDCLKGIYGPEKIQLPQLK